jgi:hypothetical protein
LEATKAHRVPHQAYSPDPAPSDFLFFGFLKEKLQGIAVTDGKNLKSDAQAIFDERPESILRSVDVTWITRFCRAIKNPSQYYSKRKKKITV